MFREKKNGTAAPRLLARVEQLRLLSKLEDLKLLSLLQVCVKSYESVGGWVGGWVKWGWESISMCEAQSSTDSAVRQYETMSCAM